MPVGSGGDWRSQVRTGQKLKGIPASFINETLDSNRAVRGMRKLAGKKGTRPDSLPEGLIYIRNDSGADVDRFAVLGISGILITPAKNLLEFQNNASLTGVTPATPTHTGKFVVCYEPIAKTKIGLAGIFGITACQVNIVSAADKWADISNGNGTQLKSGGGGAAQILYAPSGTGTQWCLVRLGTAPNMQRVNVAVTSGSSSSTGTKTTQCAFLYNVTDLSGATLLTAVAPKMQRTSIGKVVAASVGWVSWVSGAWELTWCDEVQSKTPC